MFIQALGITLRCNADEHLVFPNFFNGKLFNYPESGAGSLIQRCYGIRNSVLTSCQTSNFSRNFYARSRRAESRFLQLFSRNTSSTAANAQRPGIATAFAKCTKCIEMSGVVIPALARPHILF